MPRVKLGEKDLTLPRKMKANMALYAVPHQKIEKTLGISQSTFFKRMRDPASMTVRELVGFAKILHMSGEDVLEGLGLKGETR